VNGLTQTLLKLGPTRLFAILGTTAIVAALLFAMVFRIGGEEKALLFANVDMRDAAAITERLDQANIPYELRGDGSTIFVPRSQVLQARMMLSAEGLPASGSVGYEIFDNADALGQTQFQQNVNRLRALEGELARTIASLDGVEAARVHLVLPERQLFERDRQDPSASIVIDLRRDELSGSQVRAIRNLVASAVPGLSATHVTILDDAGRLLAAASSGDDPIGEDADVRQAAIEERIRRTVSDIVDGVVGAGNSRVQVSVDMDYNRITESSERFDPEGRVVRSTSTVEDSSSNQGASPGGGATAGANVPDGSAGGAGATGDMASTNRSEETVNYEISRTTRTEIIEGGRIRRLSVAVAVDGVTTPGADGAEAQWAPRPDADVQQIAALVRSAVGFDQARGDTVEVVSMRLERPEALPAPEAPGLLALQTSDIMRLAEVGAALIAALALVLFVMRPLITGLVRGTSGAKGGDVALEAAGPAGALPGPDGAALAAALPGGGTPGVITTSSGEMVNIANIQGRVQANSVKQIAEVVSAHPDESAQIIRGWLNNAG
jgi:flagellar M-ring protein FliF